MPSERQRAARRSLRALALAAACLGCAPAAPATRVVLITVDTLRYDSLPADAEPDAGAMPLTARYARDGRRFERFYASAPLTQPTHASFFTALHPWQHGVSRNGLVLGDGHRTVAEALSDAGFATAAVVASFPVHGELGFAQGFDAFHDRFELRVGKQTRWNELELEERNFYSLAESVTDRALELLDGLEGGRQFLWLHYFDPHAPYGDARGDPDDAVRLPELLQLAEARDPALAGSIAAARGLYDADVAALDRSLGRLFDRLAADEERFETHVLLVSDHGESFGADGSLGHGRRLTPDQLHVPCFVRSPRVAPGTHAGLAGAVDVAPTLLALAGVEADALGRASGRDLTALEPDARQTVAGMRRTLPAPLPDVRVDGSTEVLEGNRFFAVLEGVLYAGDGERAWVDEDPARPVEGELAARLTSLFARFEAELEGVAAEAATDAATRAALEDLGYAQ